jgi:RNA polymerase sigma-70 factor (TIGR02943 family)
MGDKYVSDAVSWLDRHGDVMFRFALARVRDKAVAEDLVQEALLAAIQGIGSLTDAANERSWLIGILRHKVLDHFRRCSRERIVPADVEAVDGTEGDPFDADGRWKSAPGRWNSPESSLEQEEFLRTLDLCMDSLPQNLRSAFALRELDGIACEDLAETLGTSRNNVWVLLSRARQRLRDCLERHWFRG